MLDKSNLYNKYSYILLLFIIKSNYFNVEGTQKKDKKKVYYYI